MARKTTSTPPDAPRAGVRPGKRRSEARKDSSANLGFEAKLWLAADKLRNNMDAAEYKHVVLGLIFLKYISDTFEQHCAKLLAGLGDYAGANAEDQDEYKGRIYDPCCGSGGMFVQSEKFVEAHGGRSGDISIYGQESNPTTRRLAVMNLALRGIEADFGPEHADTFRRDLHPDLRADYVLANPPFNDSDWFRKDDDVRWQFGVPPKGNANFAWVQHFIHHLAPGGAGTAGGMAGFVLAKGSMSSNQSGEGDIRKAIIEADLVDCMVALPGQLFYSTQIPVCLCVAELKGQFAESAKLEAAIRANLKSLGFNP